MLAVAVPGDPGGTLIFTRMVSQGNSCEFGHYNFGYSLVRSLRIYSRAVHASVNCFDEINGDDGNFTPVTNDYETAGDLIQLAKEILTDLTSEDPSSFQMDVFDQPMTLKTNVINNQGALKEVMDTLYNGVTWQAMGSYAPDVYQDILDQPDAYPELFTPVYE